MKRRFNLIALVVLVSVNVLTPISYAQENPESGEETIKYNCRLQYDVDGGPASFLCQPYSDGNYSCWSDDENYVCKDNATGHLKTCQIANFGYQNDEDAYRCYTKGYSKILDEGGFSFGPTWEDGEFSCGSSQVYELSTSELRSASYYGGYYCESEDAEEQYGGCEYRNHEYFCPTELYKCTKESDGYYCNLNEENGNYYCQADSIGGDSGHDRGVESITVASEGTYTCYDIYGYDSPIYNCEEEKLRGSQRYKCLFPKYTCNPEDGGYLCSLAGDEVDDGYYYCNMNDNYGGGLQKLSVNGEYSCYQPKEGGRQFTNCEFRGNGKYFCHPMYDCELDKDGYNCKEYVDGEYSCRNYSVAEPEDLNSINGDYYCQNYYNGNKYNYCLENGEGNGYFCPIKWGTKIDDNGNYECLQDEGNYISEFDEELGQCIYTVTGYDGKNI